AVVKDRLRWLHVVAGEEASSATRRADVAKARSPLHERIQRSIVALAHGSAEGNDVRFRLQTEFLPDLQARGVLEFEDEKRRLRRIIFSTSTLIRDHSIQRI